jgi:hypothetical protein
MKDPEATSPACAITWHSVKNWFRDKTPESIAYDDDIWECKNEFEWGRNGIRFDHADSRECEMNNGKISTMIKGVVSNVASCRINGYMDVILFSSDGRANSNPHMFLACYHKQFGLLWRCQVNIIHDGEYGKWQSATIVVRRVKHDQTDGMLQYIDSIYMASRDGNVADRMTWGAVEFEDPWHCKLKGSDGPQTGFQWSNRTEPLYGAGFIEGGSGDMYTINEHWWNAFEKEQLEIDNHADAQTAVTISSTIPVYLI